MRVQHLYLLGHPVGHSKSAVMYNAVYEKLGLPWHYELLDCVSEQEARTVLEQRDFLSVNITTPYKPLAYEAADERSATAELVDGANVLVNRDGRLVAHNTDGMGCVSFLQRSGFDFNRKLVAVCGTGPTALSVLTACAQLGSCKVLLLSRNAQHARDVLARWSKRETALGDRSGVRARAESMIPAAYQEAAGCIAQADLVINATPLGMLAGDPAPFDTSALHEGQWVFDCVYGHGETALVAGGRAAGCRTFDGAGMLVGQAVETVRILERETNLAFDLSNEDLFGVMAKAAGFSLE